LISEFDSILVFEGFLRRREESTDRIVDEIELQPGSGPAIAERVQALECADAPVEDATPTLLFDVLQAVARKRSDDVDALFGKECVRVLLPGFE
jgi:hypothetical protein